MNKTFMDNFLTAIEKIESPNEKMVYNDLLALGVFLNSIEEKEACAKVIKTVSNAVGILKIKPFIKKLDGKEKEIVRNIGAHLEVQKLFKL